MKLFCEGLGKYSIHDIHMNRRDNIKDKMSDEYLQLGTEYAVANDLENKEPHLNAQKLSSNQCEHRNTFKQFSGFVDFIRAMDGIQDHCCISSLMQNVSSCRAPSSDVKLIHKDCPVSPSTYPIMHYAIVSVPRRGSDFKDFQDKVRKSLDQQCRTENVTGTKIHENSFHQSGLCHLETECDDCHRINADGNGETISFHCEVCEGEANILPLSCTFLQRGDKMSALFCLEHFVMNKFKIEDIRVLWLLDERWWEKSLNFLAGYDKNQTVNHIQPFSLFPPSYVHDLSFWESSEKEFDESAFISLVREVTVGNVRELYLVETFRLGERKSRCYRMIYQSCDQALTYDEAGRLQMMVRKCIKERLDLTPR